MLECTEKHASTFAFAVTDVHSCSWLGTATGITSARSSDCTHSAPVLAYLSTNTTLSRAGGSLDSGVYAALKLFSAGHIVCFFIHRALCWEISVPCCPTAAVPPAPGFKPQGDVNVVSE